MSLLLAYFPETETPFVGCGCERDVSIHEEERFWLSWDVQPEHN